VNVVEGILTECNRVRRLIKLYDEIPQGVFASTLMRQSIAEAEKALVNCDTVQMIECYKDLQGYGDE
jgi:hypothetical protein